MSRIKWEKAKAIISSSYKPNREWPNESYFAHCPTDWPQHFAPVHLAHLQAPPIGKDRSHTTAWQAAIESAAGAGELPNVLQPFNRVRGATVPGPADMLGQRHLRWEAQSYTKNLPGIAAGDFQTWLKSQGETASEHIAAWFDARCTAPAQTPAPVATASAEPAKPLQKSAAQDAAILRQIKDFGFDPLTVPKNQPGKAGVKSAVRNALRKDRLFTGARVFDKAWERLSKNGEIVIQG